MVSRRSGAPKTTFKLDEVRRHLMLLRHEGVGVTQIDVVPVGANGPERYLGLYSPRRYDQLLADLEALAQGKPDVLFNVYVGANPRVEEALRYADHRIRAKPDVYADRFSPRWVNETHIVTRTALLFDLDHRAGGRGNPTTDAQHEQSLALARQIKDEEPLLREAALLDSGNNAYLLAVVPPDLYPKAATKEFYQHLRQRFDLHVAAGEAPCRLDPCHDGYHIMGLAGTRKIKGTEVALWRLQSVLVEGGTCHELGRQLRAYKAPERPAPTGADLTVLEAAADEEELAARIDLWCPGYRAVWTSPDYADRSLAAFHLALKMFHDGWAWEDIEHALVVWADRLEIEEKRFERIYESVRSRVPDPAYEKSRPSHRHVIDVLGHCPCVGNCDVELARSEHVSLIETDWTPPEEEEAPGLAIARAELTMGLFDELKWAMGRRGRRTKQPRAVVSTSPAGTGKTHAASCLTRYLHTCLVTPRRAEFDKLLRDSVTDLDPELDARARALAGDGADLDEHRVVTILPRLECCSEPERQSQIEVMNRAGAHALVETVVCARCPRRDACTYYTQFHPHDRCSFIAASIWTRLPRFQRIVEQSELVIFDEDPVGDCIEQIKLKARDLERARQAIGSMSPTYSSLSEVLEQLAGALHSSGGRPERVNARDLLKGCEKINLQRFGAEYEAMLAERAPGQMPPAAIPELLKTLVAQARGNAGASMVLTESREIVLLRFHPFAIRKPVLVLDATGDERLYQRLFPHHTIRREHSPTRLAADVWQICDQALPMTTLASGDKAKKVSSLIGKIAARREQDRGLGVAVIGRKEAVENMLELPPSVVTGHYWGTRGSREFEGCHTLILVGSAEPDFEWLRFEAEVVFGRRIKQDEAGQEEVVVPYGVRSSRGKSWATSIRLYKDADLRALYQARREGEMVQAAYRIRPLEGEGKLIVVLSSIPLPGLPPTRLMSLQDLELEFGLVEPSLRAKIFQAQEALRLELGREPIHREIGERLGISRQAVGKILAGG